MPFSFLFGGGLGSGSFEAALEAELVFEAPLFSCALWLARIVLAEGCDGPFPFSGVCSDGRSTLSSLNWTSSCAVPATIFSLNVPSLEHCQHGMKLLKQVPLLDNDETRC